MASAFVGQTATQFSQAEQQSVLITGFGQSAFFILATVLPLSSRTADSGHILPQEPHSMQSDAQMRCISFFSPDMACTGHILAQAPHPLHSVDME
jgi:hypothetical protein